jgi:hypothetical protein|tara:strand:+ start:6494 stop:6766 length:273 start_codon:yes stop_codon:yes gene_type:complete
MKPPDYPQANRRLVQITWRELAVAVIGLLMAGVMWWMSHIDATVDKHAVKITEVTTKQDNFEAWLKRVEEKLDDALFQGFGIEYEESKSV